MKMQNLAENQIVQSLVLLILIVSFLFAELTTYLVAGQINLILTQIFYLPVIFLSFRFAKHAVGITLSLAITYFVIVVLTSGTGLNDLAPTVMQFYVYISIGIVVGSLSSKIQSSELKYRELFRQSGNAVFLADMKSGTILESNPKFREIFVTPGQDPAGETLGRVFPDPGTVPTIKSRIEAGQAVVDMDVSVTPEKGVREDFVMSATPIDTQGLTVITLADVSRIKREDARALAESEAKYRSLVELAQEGIWAIDANGITTYINPKLLEMLGYPEQQILGHSLFEFLGEKSWIDGQQGRETGKPAAQDEQEFRFVRNDGVRITTRLSITPLTDQDGNFTGAIALVTDITDKKRAEAALRESEERFHSIFEGQMTGILLIDAGSHTILDANEKAVSMIGLPKNQVTGKICHRFICPSEAGTCPFADGSKTSDQSERILINAKGEYIPILKFVKVLVMADRQYLIETFTDISDLKNNEKDLKASLAEKSVLLMEVHHRVKNNLQIITGLIRLQSRHITNELALEALRQCENRVMTMALVHESLYQSGNLANINARQHLIHLVTNLLMSEEQDGRQVRLESDIDDVQLDLDTAIPCSLIVNELVTNSMKYAFREGEGGTIRIWLHEEPGNMFLLTVSDDGVGIPEAVNPASVSTLGLKLVSRLVRDQLKGTVDIRRDHGTTFLIRFPKKSVGE
jgi:PAS domain S-box-containing protein